MKALVFGSLNLDYVYQVDHIVTPGETLSSTGLEVYPGGKGLNQAIALSRAGAPVFMAGNVGPDGGLLRDACRNNGVNDTLLSTTETRSGNAIIQVGRDGQNSIVLFAGANGENTPAYMDETLAQFSPGDLLLLQNEINGLDVLVEKAAAAGMILALNPSPFNAQCTACDLSKISLFLLNTVEGQQICGQSEPEAIAAHFEKTYPSAGLVLTLGRQGVLYQMGGQRYSHGIYRVPVVDTTAAGDTFTGYFIAAYMDGLPPETALEYASLASSLAVSRAGATPSIPHKQEVLQARGVLPRG